MIAVFVSTLTEKILIVNVKLRSCHVEFLFSKHHVVLPSLMVMVNKPTSNKITLLNVFEGFIIYSMPVLSHFSSL